MKDGFIKVAALTPKIKVADCIYNTEADCSMLEEAWEPGSEDPGVSGAVHNRLYLPGPVLAGAAA